jgi:REP element-mobilizing transposase RayT
VFARGNDRRSIFVDDRDRVAYLHLLREVIDRCAWRCLGWCLMPNHVHLLIETTEPNLGRGMHRLHGQYVRRFHARHRRTGHLFGSRYGSVVVEDDAQLWMTVAYIARNPLAAGLCGDLADYRWSSHRAVLADVADGIVDRGRLGALLAAISGRRASDAYSDCVLPADDRMPA